MFLQSVHPTLLKTYVERRLQQMEHGKNIDWATAESLAIGSLLYQGHSDAFLSKLLVLLANSIISGSNKLHYQGNLSDLPTSFRIISSCGPNTQPYQCDSIFFCHNHSMFKLNEINNPSCKVFWNSYIRAN